MKVASSAAQGI